MSSTASSEQNRDEPPDPAAWGSPFVWSTVALGAFLVFELTAQPALSVIILCGKFGWNDLLTAIWLWRSDPFPGRGRACAWFCLSRGVGKTMLAAFLFIAIVGGILDEVRKRQGQAPPRGNEMPAAVLSAAFVMSGGMVVASLLVAAGCLSARRHGVRVWIDGTLQQARRDNLWPPTRAIGPVPGQANYASFARLALVAFGIVTGALLAVACAALASAAAGILGYFLWIMTLFGLVRGVVATVPAECWPELCPSWLAAASVEDDEDVEMAEWDTE